jgi:lysophospholipase L1-like esterase
MALKGKTPTECLLELRVRPHGSVGLSASPIQGVKKLRIMQPMSDRHPLVVGSAVRRRRAIITNLLLVVLGTVVGLVILEGLLAFVVPPPIIWRDPQQIYYFDPNVGHRMVPGQHSYTHSFPVVTNSYGLRDREFPAIPNPGVVRILCLGDSLTFGKGVAVEDTYPKQLETRLGQEGTIKYEVINAGVSAYDTWQEVAYFEEWGVRLKPNIVVIGFYVNDVVPKPESVRPFLTDEGALRSQELGGMLPDVAVYTLKRSRLLLLLRDRIGKLKNRVRPSPEVVHQQAMLEGSRNKFVERGWEEVDASLRRMTMLRDEYGFDLLLVIFPIAEQLLRDYPRAQYQTRLRVIAEENGIPTIDLLDAFRREFTGFGSLFIEWDGHPNPDAYRIAADQIAKFIRAMPRSGGEKRSNQEGGSGG